MGRNPAATTQLGAATVFAYSLPAFAMSALQIPMQYFLPAYYATHLGVSLKMVGLIFLITRLWDVVTDPVLGVVCDRLPSRFGRRRHWMVISVPILVLGAYMIFMPPSNAGPYYLLGWLFFIYIGWTLLMLSYFAWGAELSTDYDQRTRINGARDTMGLFGVVILLAAPAYLEQTFGRNDELRMHVMGWVLMIALPITVFIAVTRVPERSHKPARQQRLLPSFRYILRNAALGRLLLADVLTGIGITSTAVTFVFFVDHVLNAATYTSTSLVWYYIGGTLGIPIWVRVSTYLEKHRTLALAKLIMAAMLPLFLLLPKENGLVLMVFMAFFGIALSSGTFLLRAIVADVVDVDHLDGGQERTGFYYALLTMASKTGMALAVGLTYALLEFAGFEPGKINGGGEIRGLIIVFIGMPLAAYLAAAAVMWNFPIGRERQKAVRHEIEKKNRQDEHGFN